MEVLKRVMAEIEQEALQEAKQCESCGSVLVRNGQEKKKIKTLVGTVELNRVRLRCPKCQQDSYPLDQAIGLGEGERMTLGVRERALWAAVEVSYSEDRSVSKRNLPAWRYTSPGSRLRYNYMEDDWEYTP